MLEIFVLSDVSLRRWLNLLSDAVQSFLELDFKLSNPLLSYPTDLTDRALPCAKLIFFIFIWSHHEEESLIILIDFAVLSFSMMNVGGEVAE